MASGSPVGNMIIKVDLDSAGVEKSMTGLQRQLKSSNKAMGAQLSAFDRGDKSAAKYGVMIEGLTNRHRIQGRMVAEARTKYDHMAKTYGENSVKAQKASQELNEQIARYQETGRELDNMTAEFQEFQRVQEIQSKGWYKVADGMDEWGGKLKTAGTVMDDTGRKLTRNVTLPLTVAGGLAIKTGSDFEAGISKVGAVSGASAGDMEKLETKAREMGKTTVFSATEASDAFYYMSLAGWDATESMDGIEGVMDLAAASGEDLAQVSDIVTDGLTAFGMSAEESGRMADVLAAASANANTDVSGLGKAFSYVAPVAGALGYSMEDTSKAIGLMSDSGIKANKAGTALRKMMNSLSNPTGEAKELMNEYGISLTDSEGNMKSFDDVMLDLRKGLGGLSEDQQSQAASTIFGQEAMSGALAIVNASEEDYGKLTDAINDSDGAASDMAETMQDNLQGSLKELKSMLEDLFIEVYQNLKPALNDVVDSAKDLTNWFANLSPKTQENIIKFGLLAAAAGPVLSVTGKLTFGIGSLMQGAGGLAKTIGLSKGAGLLGALGGLGPAAIGGIAVAGLAAVGTAAYKMHKESEKAKEVNLDVAQSLSDEAIELDNAAETFDKLSNKAKISNDELAELNDLNKQISESSNPGEVEELQRQYDKLATNSGLSKEELEELFGANDEIIAQSPDVEKSISDQGKEFVKNTDAVKEYVESLYEMSRQELSDEMVIAEENKREILKDNKQLNEEINDLNEKSKDLRELEALSEEERNEILKERHKELSQMEADSRLSDEERLAVKEEIDIVEAYINDGIGAGLDAIKEQRDALNEKLDLNNEELAKIEALDGEMANIVLKQAGINEEGEKGLAKLDESIAKNDEELQKLEEKLGKNGELTEKEQERYTELVEINKKQREARDYLHDEIGMYENLNSLAEAKIEQLDEEKQKKIESLAKSSDIKVEEGNIIEQLQGKNSEHDKSIGKLEEQREKEGANKAEIDKQIDSLREKKAENSENIKKILEELGIWGDLDDKIKDGINKEIEKGNAVDDTKGKLDSQGNAIDNNNSKTDAGIGKERERTKEAGKNVNKDVNASDNGTIEDIDIRAGLGKSKKVSLYQNGLAEINRLASKPVTKKINLTTPGTDKIQRTLDGYATGTDNHPGGLSIIGEKGTELVNLPGGRSFLSPSTDTLVDLPKGTQVVPNRETKKLMQSIPRYADGTNGWLESLKNSELAKLLVLNNKSNDSKRPLKKRNNNTKDDSLLKVMMEQNEELTKMNRTLMKILRKDDDTTLDGKSLTKNIDHRLAAELRW